MEQNTTPCAGFTAYLIDPEQRTIAPVTLTRQPSALQEIYHHLQCQTISAVPVAGRDSVYVDDEGLMNGPVRQFFGIKGNGQPLAGRGLVVGLDDDGDDIAPEASLEALKSRLVFIEHLFTDLWSMSPADAPDTVQLLPLNQVCQQLGAEG